MIKENPPIMDMCLYTMIFHPPTINTCVKRIPKKIEILLKSSAKNVDPWNTTSNPWRRNVEHHWCSTNSMKKWDNPSSANKIGLCFKIYARYSSKYGTCEKWYMRRCARWPHKMECSTIKNQQMCNKPLKIKVLDVTTFYKCAKGYLHEASDQFIMK